jgi:hypothetical protein
MDLACAKSAWTVTEILDRTSAFALTVSTSSPWHSSHLVSLVTG